MSGLWLDTHKPLTLDDVIGSKDIIQMLKRVIDTSSKEMPNLLFQGASNSGKTTVVNAFINDLYGDDKVTHTLILSSNEDRGIQVVRDKIIEFSEYGNYSEHHPFKLVVIDDADSLTNDAQIALRRVIEQNISNVRYCFICCSQDNIDVSLASRCMCIKFRKITQNECKIIIKDLPGSDDCKLENLHSNPRRAIMDCQINHWMRDKIHNKNTINYKNKEMFEHYLLNECPLSISQYIEKYANELILSDYGASSNIIRKLDILLKASHRIRNPKIHAKALASVIFNYNNN